MNPYSASNGRVSISDLVFPLWHCLLAEFGHNPFSIREGELKVQVGLDLRPQPPLTALAIFGCGGGVTESNHIEGSVIGKATPIDKMSSALELPLLREAQRRPAP